MADITPYVAEIQNAIYGEEVRSSIINALVKVNDDNNSYIEMKNIIEIDKDIVCNKIDAASDLLNSMVENTEKGKETLEALKAYADVLDQISEVDTRLATLEHMTLNNDFYVPLDASETEGLITMIVDEDKKAIIADWKYQKEIGGK